MSLIEVLPTLGKVPIIGILRRCPPDRVLDVAAAAWASGLPTLEITLDSEEPLVQISRLREALPDLTVGAGTVLTASDAESAINAGAAFVVTPAMVLEVLGACVEAGVPCLPGAATPTEIWEAHRLGATAVKVFPARELGGPAYISAIHQPLRSVPLVPTGGIDPAHVHAYLQAGAAAVAMGGSMFPASLITGGDSARLTALISKAVEATR